MVMGREWPKSMKDFGPPCVRCESRKSERYENSRSEVLCKNDRGCILRRRAKVG